LFGFWSGGTALPAEKERAWRERNSYNSAICRSQSHAAKRDDIRIVMD
jgi:hypothetical protein